MSAPAIADPAPAVAPGRLRGARVEPEAVEAAAAKPREAKARAAKAVGAKAVLPETVPESVLAAARAEAAPVPEAGR
ncbi:MAG: alpha/beta hydrolase, partial [Candidatus Binatia bacterium]